MIWSAIKKALRYVLHLFAENAVVKNGVSLSIVIGASTTLKHAIMISLVAFYISLILSGISMVIRIKAGKNFKMIVLCIVAALLYIPAGYLIPIYYLQVYDSLGIYLPLLAVSSILISAPAETEIEETPVKGWYRSIKSVAGFALFSCIAGTIREFVTFGTIYEISLTTPFKVPGAGTIFAGFILTGMLVAAANSYLKQDKKVKQ